MDKQAIQYPITPCETIGCDAIDHFRGVTKMIGQGSRVTCRKGLQVRKVGDGN